MKRKTTNSKISSPMSTWYRAKPGKSENGNDRPQISGNIELSPQMVKMIIANGELHEDEYLELRVSAWPQPHENNQPTHRGRLQFSDEQIEEFQKTKSA